MIEYRASEGAGSSVSIVSGYGLDGRTIEVRSPAKVKMIFTDYVVLDRHTHDKIIGITILF
jgi:hypothetical protein